MNWIPFQEQMIHMLRCDVKKKQNKVYSDSEIIKYYKLIDKKYMYRIEIDNNIFDGTITIYSIVKNVFFGVFSIFFLSSYNIYYIFIFTYSVLSKINII